MNTVVSAEYIGGAVRRVREELGMSRAELSRRTGVGSRTIYAFEMGKSPNFGLSSLIKILDALGMSLSVEMTTAPISSSSDETHIPQWDPKGTLWDLEADAK